MSEHKSKYSLIAAQRKYLDRICALVQGLKLLIVDESTKQAISLVYTQSELLGKGVALTELIEHEAKRAPGQAPLMHYMKAVVLVRPTAANVVAIASMLNPNPTQQPRFTEVHLFFSNVVPEEHLKAIAEADRYELVRQVHEFYMDFWAPAHGLFHAQLHSISVRDQARDSFIDRNAAVIFAAIRALDARVLSIRYLTESDAATKVAQALAQQLHTSTLTMGSSATMSILILDRREDPVTPLLSSWTYRGMLHELMTLVDNCVEMPASSTSTESKRQHESTVVLSEREDAFYRLSTHCYWGDLLTRAKQQVADLQTEEKSVLDSVKSDKLDSVIERLPDYRFKKASVAKHMSLLTTLSQMIETRNLGAIGLLEQDLVAPATHLADTQELFHRVCAFVDGPVSSGEGVKEKMKETKSVCQFYDKTRLVALYSLRFTHTRVPDVALLNKMLMEHALTEQDKELARAVQALWHYSGDRIRRSDLFGEQSFLNRTRTTLGGVMSAAPNPYLQHQPLLLNVVQDFVKQKLHPKAYATASVPDKTLSVPPNVYLVFIVGGVTYEELRHVTEASAKGTTPIVLGGSCVHNSHSFLENLMGMT